MRTPFSRFCWVGGSIIRKVWHQQTLYMSQSTRHVQTLTFPTKCVDTLLHLGDTYQHTLLHLQPQTHGRLCIFSLFLQNNYFEIIFFNLVLVDNITHILSIKAQYKVFIQKIHCHEIKISFIYREILNMMSICVFRGEPTLVFDLDFNCFYLIQNKSL